MANSCLKGAFCVVNFLYTILAITLALGAIYFSLVVKEITDLRNYEKYQLDSITHWPQILPYIVVGIAVLLCIVMCCGCGGVSANSKSLLIIYSVFITIVILVLTAVATVATGVAIHESEKFTNETMVNVFNEALIKPSVAKKFGEFEQTLHCCGVEGARQYSVFLGKIPESCCDVPGEHCDAMNERKGCLEVANHWVKWIFILGTTVSGLTAFLCVISLILAIAILRNMRSKDIV